MATIPSTGSTANSERKFYTRMAIALSLIVLIGFTPSFYSFQTVSFPKPNPPLTLLTLVHGLVFTGWMIMIILQTQLISANRRDLHIKLGVWGFALAVAMVPLMYFTGVHSIPRGFHPPYATGEQWAALPLFTIPVFSIFIWLGWKYRRDPQAHKRLMLMSAAQMIEPAFGRMPLGPPVVETNLLGSALALGAIILPMLWRDKRQNGAVHWVTKFGFVLMLVVYIVRYAVWGTDGWAKFVMMLPG